MKDLTDRKILDRYREIVSAACTAARNVKDGISPPMFDLMESTIHAKYDLTADQATPQAKAALVQLVLLADQLREASLAALKSMDELP